MGLFSCFDISSSVLNLNFLSFLMIYMLVPSIFWVLKSPLFFILNKILLKLNKEFYLLNYPKIVPGVWMFMLSLFVFVCLMNFLGLFPYVFPLSSQPSLVLSLFFPLWVGKYLFAWVNHFNLMVLNLVPLGTPLFLVPLMVLIELMSGLIRPVTLVVRLVANISAGHLLLTLITSLLFSMKSFFLFMLLLVFLILFMLIFMELVVSVIQGYVFSMLLSFYVKEVNF